MRSRTLIIGDERQEDFDRLAAGWRAEYGDEGQATESLLQRVILGDWFLQRAERRYMELECELAAFDSLDWTEEQHKKMELHLRYKTGAERSFHRALNSLRGLRKDKIREELDFETMRERAKDVIREVLPEMERERQGTAQAVSAGPVVGTVAEGGRASEVFQGQNHPKKRKKLVVLDQLVEVEREEGRTVTRLYPSNEGLIKEGQKMDPPPDLVYRRISFPNGIPEEYGWVSSSNAERFERGGMGTQRMTVDTWLDVIEREAASGTGHVGPTGVGNLPRPMERGGCECEVCARNREVLEKRGVGR